MPVPKRTRRLDGAWRKKRSDVGKKRGKRTKELICKKCGLPANDLRFGFCAECAGI